MHKRIFAGVTLTLCLCLQLGCKKDPDELLSTNTNYSALSSEENESVEIKLGEQYNDPYDFDHMQKVIELLKERGEVPGDIQIEPTNLYIQFKPQSWEEYDRLKTDTGIELYDYPLDVEVLNEGDYYHDPEASTDSPTWQYTAVPLNYDVKHFGVGYEEVRPLYIPENDEHLKKREDYLFLVDLITDEAEQMANPELIKQEDEGTLRTSGSYRISKFKPFGKIQVNDTKLKKLIPVPGVKVRARRWANIKSTLTNDQGDYTINHSFRRPVNYAVVYERADFDIRSGAFGQAWYNGPKKTGSWNLDIQDNPQRFYAHIHRAALDYYYNYYNMWGVGSPPPKASWRPALKISAYNKDDGSINGHTHPWTRVLGAISVICIYNPNRLSDQIYSTTIHELGHAAHWWQNDYAYRNCEDKVSESWGRGIQWLFTTYRYISLGDVNYNFGSDFDMGGGYQNMNTANSDFVKNMRKGYTPIVVDLMDTVNQRNTHHGNLYYAPDNVKGFTISEIWNALDGAQTLDDWKHNLIKLNKAPVTDMDELFNFYKNI